MYLHSTPIWRLENSVTSGTYLGYLGGCISTEQRNIYISTIPKALTSKQVINHKINIYFLLNAIIALCQGLRAFPNEAHQLAEKLETEIKIH